MLILNISKLFVKQLGNSSLINLKMNAVNVTGFNTIYIQVCLL